MLLNADDIAALCQSETPLITPYVPGKVRQLPTGLYVPSFGQDEVGYSITPTDEWHVCVPGLMPYTIDVARDGVAPVMQSHVGPYVDIPPNSFVLARSVERFHIPRNVIGISLGKSSYLRCGVDARISPLEPDWRGHLTFEIANLTPYPNRVYAGAGITQLIFIWLTRDAPGYVGPYQDQAPAIVQARVREGNV